MMSATGNNSSANSSPRRQPGGFTLVELICVMALLTIVMSLTAPALAHFFRGRSLDSEVRRFLGLTRYAQSRAVSEGVPMVLWMDAEQGKYGLKAEMSYADEDAKAAEFELARDLKMEVQLPVTGLDSVPWKVTTEVAGNRPAIRFTADGFMGDNSPDYIIFRQEHEGEQDEKSIGRSRNRLSYEITTNILQAVPR